MTAVHGYVSKEKEMKRRAIRKERERGDLICSRRKRKTDKQIKSFIFSIITTTFIPKLFPPTPGPPPHLHPPPLGIGSEVKLVNTLHIFFQDYRSRWSRLFHGELVEGRNRNGELVEGRE